MDISHLPNDATRPAIAVRMVFMRPEARALYASEDGGLPGPATPLSAGLDLCACFSDPEITLMPGARVTVPVGIAIQPVTPGWAGFIYSRSGLGARRGLCVAQGVGVIDPDYTGEILVVLLNTSPQAQALSRGERVAQLVFQPYAPPRWEEVNELSATKRGAGGFGHTGL